MTDGLLTGMSPILFNSKQTHQEKTPETVRRPARIVIRRLALLIAIYQSLITTTKRSKSGNSAGSIFRRAVERSKNSARSISGNSCLRPDFGGHSSSKVLLRIWVGSQSP